MRPRAPQADAAWYLAPAMATAPQASFQLSRGYAALALAVWAALTFGHGLGLDLAAAMFRWASRPDTLGEGNAGRAALERLLAAGFLALAAVVLGGVVWRLRAYRARLHEEALPWVLWALYVLLIWRVYIVYTTELMHFAQYALIGALVAMALDRGRRPQLAFVITVALGYLDEVWQHYGLHVWQRGDPNHWMDWSDPILDAAGACAGILPFVTAARLRGEPLRDDTRALRWAVLASAVLLLPLLLLDPVTQARWLGSYRLHPWWQEFSNDKPVHWPGPREGIPLCIGGLLLLGSVLDPRRRGGLSGAGVLLLLALLAVAIEPPSRARGQPVHEVVPTARAPFAETPVVVDGKLDDEVWARAELLGPFVAAKDGRSVLRLGDGSEEPLAATYARVAWDRRALYVAFECADDDVWAREVGRDDPGLPADEVVEVFVDDGGDERTWYEFELSPAGVLYDLFVLRPASPLDHDPGQPFLPFPRWSASEVEVAVQVQGEVTFVKDRLAPRAAGSADRGWTAELAIPWVVFKNAVTPNANTKRKVVPEPGEPWRIALYRIERPRPTPEAIGPPGATLALAEARARLGANETEWSTLLERKQLVPDAEGRVPQAQVARLAAQRRAQLQAWSPPYNASFHQPHRFGVLELLPPRNSAAAVVKETR